MKPLDTIAERVWLRRRWGQFFSQARVSANLTCEDLDSRLGLRPGTYSAWERGFCLPALKSIGLVMAHFDVHTNLKFQLLFNQLRKEVEIVRAESLPDESAR